MTDARGGDAVIEAALRIVWTALVVGAGAALTRGLWLTTHIGQVSPQAQEAAEAGRLWLWAATAMLAAATVVAVRRWRAPLWGLGALALAGPVGLIVEDLGWIPLVALVVVGPLLLIGLTGVLTAPPRS
jgi:hypothetical protein